METMDLPTILMHTMDILFPKPDSMITPEIRNAITTSHVVESPKPINTSLRDNNLTRTEKHKPTRTVTAIGMARKIREKIMEIKTMKI